jgi:hypothetical protein
MKYSKLRIVWSVVWGIIALLLCALWVQSSSTQTAAVGPCTRLLRIHLDSVSGRIIAGVSQNDPANSNRWTMGQHGIEAGELNELLSQYQNAAGFGRIATPTGLGLILPHWFAVLACVVLAAIPWRKSWPRQFSLRTLLIVMTAIAMLLGLLIWAATRLKMHAALDTQGD